MEKKLTDEEIVKALKFAIAQGEPDGIGFWNSDMKWCEFSMSDVLNLIHRLQSEKTEQKEIIEKQVKIYEKLENSYGELVQENAEQKAEIERLKTFIDFKTANVVCEKCKQQTAKDTAKEIFTELLKGENVCEEVVKDYYGGDYIMSAVTVDKIRELAKEKYGVEVE